MGVVITSTAFSDEYIPGSTPNFNVNVSDVITTTINLYVENTIDAGTSSSYSITVTNTKDAGINGAGFDGNSGHVVFILNDDFSTGVDESLFIDLLDKEVTSANFNTNYTGTVLSVGTLGFDAVVNASSEFSNRKYIVISDIDLSSGKKSKGDGVVYFSGNIESASIDYALVEGGNSSPFFPALDIFNSTPANFSTPTNILDASDTVTVHNIPFRFDGAYKTGSLTIQGKGNNNVRQYI